MVTALLPQITYIEPLPKTGWKLFCFACEFLLHIVVYILNMIVYYYPGLSQSLHICVYRLYILIVKFNVSWITFLWVLIWWWLLFLHCLLSILLFLFLMWKNTRNHTLYSKMFHGTVNVWGFSFLSLNNR